MDTVQLPSALQINQVALLQFRKEDKPIYAKVIGVHFHKGTVKYDLELNWIDETVEVIEQYTRIYNVNAKFLTAA